MPDDTTQTVPPKVVAKAKPSAAAKAKPTGVLEDADSDHPEWSCHIPTDPLAPRLTVKAQTPGDAERQYKAAAGINATEHVIDVRPFTADE